MSIPRHILRPFGLLLRISVCSVLSIGSISEPTRLAAQSSKATKWLSGCENGKGEDCFDLAKAYLKGKERLAIDPVLAARYYARACEFQRAVACQEYGEALLSGADGIVRDSSAALAPLARACELDPGGKSGRSAGVLGGRNRCQALVELFRRRLPDSREDSVLAKRVITKGCREARIEAACVLLDAGWRSFPDSVALPDSVKRLRAEAAARQARLDSVRVAASVRRILDSAAAERARRAAPPRPSTRLPQRPAVVNRDSIRRVTLKGGCGAGNAASCAQLADLFRTGRGGPANPTQAAALAARACQLDRKFCTD